MSRFVKIFPVHIVFFLLYFCSVFCSESHASNIFFCAFQHISNSYMQWMDNRCRVVSRWYVGNRAREEIDQGTRRRGLLLVENQLWEHPYSTRTRRGHGYVCPVGQYNAL